MKVRSFPHRQKSFGSFLQKRTASFLPSEADTYACRLANDIHWDGDVPAINADPSSVAWQRAGLMDVTGFPDALGLDGPPGLMVAADGAAALFAAMTGLAVVPRGAALLGERARLLGLSRGGNVSPGGSCRILAARDGWLAVNLARADDWEALPAWLEADAGTWDEVESAVGAGAVQGLLERARLMGLAVAGADEAAPRWCTMKQVGDAVASRTRRPVVVDLSALWAGPLAGALLAAAGARVIKVEDVRRPDGARQGHSGFFDRLHGEKESVALDFGDPGGVAALRRLVAGADIVLESARPRGLRQLGIAAEHFVAARPGMVWVSITAHGRDGDAGLRVGFGDDAAIAGGVGRAMADRYGKMMFAGDAVADPLTGLHAACAAWGAWARGGGALVCMTLAGVVARALAACDEEAWGVCKAEGALYPLPRAVRPARALGADTRAVFASIAV